MTPGSGFTAMVTSSGRDVDVRCPPTLAPVCSVRNGVRNAQRARYRRTDGVGAGEAPGPGRGAEEEDGARDDRASDDGAEHDGPRGGAVRGPGGAGARDDRARGRGERGGDRP